MSRKLDRERSEANALRTLDERRAAQAAQERNNAARPAPGGSYADDRRAPPPQGYGYGQAPAPAQPPVIVQQNGGSGLGHIVAGAILARSMSNAHANNNNNGANNNGSNGGYYPAPSGSAGDLANQAGAGSVGAGSVGAGTAAAGQARPAAPASSGSVLGTIVWLCVLALVVWGIWRVMKRRKARREADKPNYSFERN
jgi:uncharacterized protein YgiB involved in biofilm formation